MKPGARGIKCRFSEIRIQDGILTYEGRGQPTSPGKNSTTSICRWPGRRSRGSLCRDRGSSTGAAERRSDGLDQRQRFRPQPLQGRPAPDWKARSWFRRALETGVPTARWRTATSAMMEGTLDGRQHSRLRKRAANGSRPGAAGYRRLRPLRAEGPAPMWWAPRSR